MDKKILLDKVVMVSDPCYQDPTWCQVKLENVKPGYYNVFSKDHDCGPWGIRKSMLLAVHEDYINKNLRWEEHPGEIGVDSGQAGIFAYDTYQNDNYEFDTPQLNTPFVLPFERDGDKWYGRICNFTLGDESWGAYDKGVVSSSGIGDGAYTLYTAEYRGKVVAMAIDFGVEEEPVIDFKFYETV
mgnify:CR=1 FL=1